MLGTSLVAALSATLSTAVTTAPPLSSSTASPVVHALPCDEDPLAAAITEISAERLIDTVQTLVGFGTRNSFSTTQEEHRGVGAARRWLEAELLEISAANGGRLEVRTQSFTESVRRRRGESREGQFVNVLGFLPGRDVGPTGRTYLVSGHYDSMVEDPFDANAPAPGADDDASGTAVVLELARVLSSRRFSANLVFLFAAGEEQGLYGSKHFATRATEDGLALDGMITNDIVGGIEGGTPDGSPGPRDEWTIRCFSGGDGLHDPSRELARDLFDAARRYDPETKIALRFRLDRFGRGGDHIPFDELGIPALRLTEAHEFYARQHKVVGVVDGVAYGDLPQFVSAPYMQRVARANAALLGSLASAPPAPESLRLTGAMRYETRLRWAESPGAAGYVVVWRETTAPVWEHETEVVTGTELVLPVIADDHFFGVRAVDAAGHRSRTTVPARP